MQSVYSLYSLFMGAQPISQKEELDPVANIPEESKEEEVQQQSTLVWIAQNTIVTNAGAPEIIDEKKKSLNDLVQTDELTQLIKQKVMPKVVDLVKGLPTMLGDESTWKNALAAKAIKIAGPNLFLWIEATIFSLAVNVANAAKIGQGENKNVLYQLLEFLAYEANDNLEEIIEQLTGLEIHIAGYKTKIKDLKNNLRGVDLDTQLEFSGQIQALQRAKKEMQIRREELFIPLRDALLQIACPNGAEDITLPSPIPFFDLKEWLYSYGINLLPELMANTASKMIKSKTILTQTLSAEKEAVYTQLKGTKRLELLGKKAFEMAKPKIWDFMQSNAFVMSQVIDELFRDENGISNALGLGVQLKEAINNPKLQEQLNPQLERIIESFVIYALKNLAINSPIKEGDAFTKVMLLFRQRMAEQNINSNLVEVLEEYSELTDGLKKLDSELAQLQKEAIALFEENPAVDNGKGKEKAKNELVLREQIEHLKDEIEGLRRNVIEVIIDSDLGEDDPDLAEYIDEMNKIIDQRNKLLFDNLQLLIEVVKGQRDEEENRIHDVCMETHGQSLEECKAELEKQVEPFISQIMRDAGLENTIWESVGVKFFPSFVIKAYMEFGQAHRGKKQHEENIRRRTGSDKLSLAAGKYAQTVVKHTDNWIVKNMSTLADQATVAVDPTFLAKRHQLGVDGMGDIGKNLPKDSELLMPMLLAETTGQIVEIFDGLTENLSKIQNENPEFAIKMTMEFIGKITEHLAFANQVVKAQGKVQMHEVSDMREAFEAGGKLHRAMPSANLLKKIERLDSEIKRVKRLEKTDENQSHLKGLKRERKNLKAEVEKGMNDHFYTDFSEWVLNMAGKYGPEDLSVPSAFRQKAWELVKDKILPSALMSVFETVISSEMINQQLAGLVKVINKNLTVPSQANISTVKTEKSSVSKPEDKEKMVQFLEQLAAAMPGTLMASMLNWKFIKNMGAEQLESVLKTSLKEFQMDKFVETLLVDSADKLSAASLSVSPDELAAEKLKQWTSRTNENNIHTIDTESEQIIDNAHTKLNDTLSKHWWGVIIRAIFGRAIDWIFLRLHNDVHNNAPNIRKNVVLPVHASVLFELGDLLMASYQPRKDVVV